jgi:hypothetical protein
MTDVKLANPSDSVHVAHDVDRAAIAQQVIELRPIGEFADPRQVDQQQPASWFSAIHDWHFEVDQNYVRVLGHGQLAALLAVLSRENLEIATPLTSSARSRMGAGRSRAPWRSSA